jgi:YidC/Oxa1 family membrane protein insertase
MFAGSIFDGFYDFFGSILAWFYSLTPNVGLAILLLTIAVMIVITPLTLKSTRSMLQMQRLQPELKKLQEKYKGDRERLNAEMMAFYKEHQINPISGCVPMLAQTPVFLLMYRVVRGITTRAGGAASGIGHVAGQLITTKTTSGAWPANFTPWKLTDQPFAPEHLAKSSEMYRALAKTTTMKFLGMDLSVSPFSALKLGIGLAIPSLLLMLLMVGSQMIQNRQIQGRNNSQPVNSQQQLMMKVLPFMLPVISFFYPAGLGLYYFVQGLARIGTQSYITRKFYGDNAPGPLVVTSKEVSSNGSNGSSPDSSSSAKPIKAAPVVERKQGSSAKSQAAQKKRTTGGSTGGRKSGEPRGGRSR